MPTPTYILLSTINLSNNVADVIFSGIPATYRDLVLVINGQVAFSGQVEMELYLNNDTVGGNYRHVFMEGGGSGSGGSGLVTGSPIVMSNTRSSHVIQIFDYSTTDKHKTMLISDDLPSHRVRRGATKWLSSAAVNSIRLTDNGGVNISSGTTFNLYGIGA
jgi:hypothetical protein